MEKGPLDQRRVRGVFGSVEELNHLLPKIPYKDRRIFLWNIVRRELGPFIQDRELRQEDANNVIGLLGEFLVKPPSHTEFARHFPKAEYQSLADLAYGSVSRNEPLSLSVGACADYQGPTYDSPIGTGIGDSADRLLKKFPEIKDYLGKYSMKVVVHIDVSDAESADPILRNKLSVGPEEFVRLTRISQDSIRTEAAKLGFSDTIRVSSILRQCEQADIDYPEAVERSKRKFYERKTKDPKLQRLVDGLIEERKRKEEYKTIPPEEYELMAISELAAYAVYGELIGPFALICSPHAKSAVKAYNILKKDRDMISPTLYIGDSPVRGRAGGWE